VTLDGQTRGDGPIGPDADAPVDRADQAPDELLVTPVEGTTSVVDAIEDVASAELEDATPIATPAEAPVEATAIFIDASAIVALVDRDDASHGAAVEAYRNLVRAGYKLFTTNYVVAETFDLLRTGVGPLVARQFLRDSKLAVYHADEQDERRARRLVLDARAGGNLTLFDAISLVVMERLGVADAFAVDPTFLADGN
jgi:predicted nucleic acid-binding protein